MKPAKTELALGTRPPLTGVSRALRSRNAEKVSKMSPGACGLDPEKVSKKSRDSPKVLSRYFPETLQRLPRLSPRLWRCLWGPRPEAPREIFETFSAFRARRARETKGRAGSQSLRDSFKVLILLRIVERREALPSTGSKLQPTFLSNCIDKLLEMLWRRNAG